MEKPAAELLVAKRPPEGGNGGVAEGASGKQMRVPGMGGDRGLPCSYWSCGVEGDKQGCRQDCNGAPVTEYKRINKELIPE